MPLHFGRMPIWFTERMGSLSEAVIEAVVQNYGKSEVLTRLEGLLLTMVALICWSGACADLFVKFSQTDAGRVYAVGWRDLVESLPNFLALSVLFLLLGLALAKVGLELLHGVTTEEELHSSLDVSQRHAVSKSRQLYQAFKTELSSLEVELSGLEKSPCPL